MANSLFNQKQCQLEASAARFPKKAQIYIVKRGDTLSQIILSHYKARPNTSRYQDAESSILLFNKHIQHPDKIFAGDVIRLMALPEASTPTLINARPNTITKPIMPPIAQVKKEPMLHDPSAIIRDKIPKDRHEQAAFELLVALDNSHGLINAGLGGGINAFGNLVGQGNSALVREITALYQEYKAGNLRKGQYDYRKKKIVNTVKKRMGPLFMREQLNIDRRKAFSPTGNIERHADRIAKLSRLATKGGIIMAGVGAAMSCRDIANTADQQEKNEIFVETTVATITGFTTSAVMGYFLISNPVGWGVAVILGIGASAMAWTAGVGGRIVYDNYLTRYDLVHLTRLDQLCK